MTVMRDSVLACWLVAERLVAGPLATAERYIHY